MPRGVKKIKPKKCTVYQVKKYWRVRTEGNEVDWCSVDEDMNVIPINYPSLETALRECNNKGFEFSIEFDKAE